MPEMTLTEAIDRLRSLQDYIDNALENEVTEVMKEEIADSVEPVVYTWPAADVFAEHRRGVAAGSGGIGDPNNIEGVAANGILTITDSAQLQNIWGGGWSADVAGVVQSASPEYFNQPYPRPFLETAAIDAIGSGKVNEALKLGIEKHGLGVD